MGSAPMSNVSVFSADATPLEQTTPPRSADDVNLAAQQLSQKMTLPEVLEKSSVLCTFSDSLLFQSLSESPPSSPSVQLLNESPPAESSSDLVLSRTVFDTAIDFHREQRPSFLHSVTESSLWERRRQKHAAADKSGTARNGNGHGHGKAVSKAAPGSAPNVTTHHLHDEKVEPKKNETAAAIIMKSDSVLENLDEKNNASVNVTTVDYGAARGDPRNWKSTSS